MKYRPIEERFWEKVDKKSDEECWEWKAHRTDEGYGTLKIGVVSELAHRISYGIYTGQFPVRGICVLHTCDNPPCVNPHHLYIGTKLDNAQDRKNRGRNGNLKWEHNGRSKLKREDILEIRRLYSTGKLTQNLLGKMFCIRQSQISAIIMQKTWKGLL
jgi:hypothetical protein